MNKYPGYDEDPRIKRSIDKCQNLGLSLADLKQKKSPGKWYKIRTLRGSICTPKYGVTYLPVDQVQVGSGPPSDMDITHLYHHSSVEYLEDILMNGLITKSPFQYNRSHEDDHEQLIFFNYLAQGSQGIDKTRESNMSASNTMFVLDYKKIYEDYRQGKFENNLKGNSSVLGSLVDISIYPDLRNFDDMMDPIWTQTKQESERQSIPTPSADELVFEFGLANPMEKGFFYFPIAKYIECIYTTADQTHQVSKILKQQGLRIKVYTVQNKHLKPTDVFDPDPRFQQVLTLCQNKRTNKTILQDLATQYNLPKSGTKQEICNRLLHFIQF